MQMSTGHLPDTGWTVSAPYISAQRKWQSSPHRQEEGKYYLYQSHTITSNGETAKLKAAMNITPQSISENTIIDLTNAEEEGVNIISADDVSVLTQTANLDFHMIMKYFNRLLHDSGLELSVKDFGFIEYLTN